jgi:hypothetical protein
MNPFEHFSSTFTSTSSPSLVLFDDVVSGVTAVRSANAGSGEIVAKLSTGVAVTADLDVVLMSELKSNIKSIMLQAYFNYQNKAQFDTVEATNQGSH